MRRSNLYRLLALMLACLLLFSACGSKNVKPDDDDKNENEEYEIREEIGAGNVLVTEIEREPEVVEPVVTVYDTVLHLDEALPLPEISNVTASQVFVYDVNSERLVYVKGVGESLYPASITKLLTILMAFDYLDAEETISIGDEVTTAMLNTWLADDYAVCWMVNGQTVTAELAAEGMILASGSDAAYVLAAAAARKAKNNPDMSGADAVAKAVSLMQEYADAMGMSGTTIMNVDGHSDNKHVSTIEDMALLAAAAYKSPVVRKYCGVASDEVSFSNTKIKWTNTNKLLQTIYSYYCPYVSGMKTGSVDGSYNVISVASAGSQTYIIGVFGDGSDEQRYTSSRAIIRYLLGDWDS